MTTIAINTGSVRLPNAYAVFMYSPFPIIVESASLASVDLYVYCYNNGRSHTETRSFYNGQAEFDLARIAQLLAPDVDEVFQMGVTQDGDVSPYANLEFELGTPDGEVLLTKRLAGIYGALDQTEARFTGKPSRRVWLNYPQTLQLWRDISDELLVSGPLVDGDWYPSITGDAAMYEMGLWYHVAQASQASELYEHLKSGRSADVALSCLFGGTDTVASQNYYELTLVPDLAPRGEGTYLRWLHRDGTFGYWLFQNGALKTDAARGLSFARHIDGNPAEPVELLYRNRSRADFTEARQMSLGTLAGSAEEYEYLCGLVTSPVVDRLVTVKGKDRWQRVNVVPGSYSRSMRRDTPNGQLFELAIELPQRNTITL